MRINLRKGSAPTHVNNAGNIANLENADLLVNHDQNIGLAKIKL
jgi:hypothetical protein